jgi:hypothetical protein
MVQLQTNPIRCSKCNSSNSHLFTRTSFQGSTQIIKCLDCNHEKVESVTTTTSTNNSQIYNYSQIIDYNKTF